jgi:hypothetical protein
MRLKLSLIVLTISFLLSGSASFASDAVWVHVRDKTTVDAGDRHEESYPTEDVDQSETVHYQASVFSDGYAACDGQCACGDCGHDEACHCGSGECYGVDTDPGRPRKPCRTLPGDRNRGDCPPLRYRMCDSKRTGRSEAVAPWAICGRPNTHFGRYTAWFVGGGAAFADVPGLSDLGCAKDLIPRGRDRKAIGCGQHGEGTWGLDYQGFAGHAKVWLKYTTGFQGKGRAQGGEGAYRTDGEPKIVAKLKEALHH